MPVLSPSASAVSSAPPPRPPPPPSSFHPFPTRSTPSISSGPGSKDGHATPSETGSTTHLVPVPASAAPSIADSSPSSPERPGVSREPSAATTTTTKSTSTVANHPSMRYIQTIQKLTTAKATQAKSLAEARREHTKVATDAEPHPAACSQCIDFATRGSALMAELEVMDRTLREMEDAVVDEVREWRAARRKEKREKERARKRASEKERLAAQRNSAEVRPTAVAAV